MPPLHLRQEFPTLRHFKEALHAWAIEAHFEPRILKSDTGRVRVGCKRDPNCPFVIRCNWERKNGREPLARVTVLRERHTCVNGVLNSTVSAGNGGDWGANMGMGEVAVQMPQLEIRTDPTTGSVIGGARVLGPISRPVQVPVPVPAGPLPKVQRNSASRLPFLMEILPRLMRISKETTPGEIRDCLMREYGAEVHLQQCRRAKTEILKRREGELEGQQQGQSASNSGSGAGDNNGNGNVNVNVNVNGNGGTGGSMDGMGSSDAGDNNPSSSSMFGNPNQGVESTPGLQTPSTMHATPSNDVNVGVGPEYPLPLHTASGVVIPQVTPRREAALNAVGEQPVRCPYCVNHRWMRTVRDAVEHMSMHVVV